MKDHKSIPVLAGVQKDHYNSQMCNFENRYEKTFYKELMDLADQVISGKCEKRYIFLLGTPGSGKTHFLTSLFRSKVQADDGVIGAQHALYMCFGNLVQEIIAGFSDSHSTRIGLAPYLTADWLFLDDISRGEKIIDANKIEGQILREVLLSRWEDCRHLVATANYDAITLRRLLNTVYGSYVLSRVMGSSIFIEFPKADWRTEKYPKKK